MTYASGVGNINKTVDYTKMLEQMYAQQQAKVAQGSVATNPVSNEMPADTYTSSQTSIEGCKDGQNDGKIGFWEGVKSFGKGVLKGAVNSVKGMFTNKEGKFSIGKTLLSAATIAACFIPVVGPVIGGCLAAVGVVSGGVSIVKSAINASKATTDAEKREALSDLGSGTLTTVVSAVALKGSAGALKGQLSGGSATVNGIRSGSLKGAKAIGKSALQETGSNMAAAGRAIRDKASNTYKKAGKTVKDIRDNGIGNTARDIAHKGIEGAKTKLGQLDNAIQNYNPKSQTNAAIETAKYAQTKGGIVDGYYKNGVPKKITMADGTVHTFTKNGTMTTTTTTAIGKNGTQTITDKGNVTTTEKVFHNADGKVRSGYRTIKNEATGVTTRQNVSFSENGGTSTYSRYNSNARSGFKTNTTAGTSGYNSTTTYMIDGKMYTADQISALTKGFIKLDSTAAGNIINYELPISDKALMLGSVLDKDLEA